MKKERAPEFETVRELREWLRPQTSIKAVALAVGMDDSALSRMERGIREPDMAQMHALSTYYSSRAGRSVPIGEIATLFAATRLRDEGAGK